jgi:DNA-binding GntR family transcriptional regulator
MKKNKVERRHLRKEINATIIEGRIARILGVPDHSLGILISAVSYGADEKEVIEYTLSYYPSERNSFILKIAV